VTRLAVVLVALASTLPPAPDGRPSCTMATVTVWPAGADYRSHRWVVDGRTVAFAAAEDDDRVCLLP